MSRRGPDRAAIAYQNAQYLRALALETPQGKGLKGFLQGEEESDADYSRRVLLWRETNLSDNFGMIGMMGDTGAKPDNESDDTDGSGLPSRREERLAAQSRKAADLVTRRLDLIVKGFTTIGKKLLRAADRGDARETVRLLEIGAPVNFRDPANGATALHYAAAYGARNVVRALIATGDCNHLIHDTAGRLSSEMAGIYAEDPVLTRYLGIKERRQADREGTSLAPSPF